MTEKLYHLGVKALIQDDQNRFLLLKVNQKKFKNKISDCWDIPGGRVQIGQSINETLLREVQEETNLTNLIDINPFDMTVSTIEIPLSDEKSAGLIMSVFTCEVKNLKNIKLSEEHTEYKWCSHDEALIFLATKFPSSFIEKFKGLAP